MKTNKELTEEIIEKWGDLDDDAFEKWALNHPQSDRIGEIMMDLLFPEPNRRYESDPQSHS